MKKWMVVLLVLIGMRGMGQVISFQKAFGMQAEANSIQQTSDDGYIIVGNIFSIDSFDVYLVKTNSYGDTLWTKTYGGIHREYGYSILQTKDGGYIISGITNSFGAGGFDFYVIKTDSKGDTLWTKTYGGVGDDYAYSIQQTTDGGYIIAGNTNSFGAGGNDIYLVKTDLNGDILWTKTFGGIGEDFGSCVQQTSDDGYIITGSTYSFNIDGVGGPAIYLIRLNSQGDTLWTKIYGASYGDYVQQTSDGGFIVTGTTYDFIDSGQDIYLIKTDENGAILWSMTYGGTGFNQAINCQQTTDGGYIIGGWTDYLSDGNIDICLIKTDENGNISWTNNFGTKDQDWLNSMHQTSDGGYILAGYSQYYGFYLIKTDENGNCGCNQYQRLMATYSPLTIVSKPGTQVSSGCFIGTTTTKIGNSGAESAICFHDKILPNNIYPNPFSTSATLINNGGAYNNSNLYFFNLLGQKLMTIPIINQKEITINRDNLAEGMYFYKIIDKNNETLGVGKMIVEL